MPLSAGDKLGHYEIVALIGQGGMGEVYQARDPRVGRDVAIKISAERFNERFDREARAVAALNHPNICTLYDVGPNYLVMELVEGPTLAERIKEGAIPLDESLAIARQISNALDAAHEKAIVHRDLKPGNVKVKADGTVKVLDFGLAKVGRAATSDASTPAEDSPTLSMAATQAGVILGTAAYMSPEQARGKPVDKRADIWAFGVVLYEMLAGRRLFKGEDISEVLAGVIKEEPRWEPIPVQVRRLIKKCLEKDPKRRLRDIADVWELLDSPQTTVAPAPARSSWLGKIVVAVALLVTVALTALAIVHFREKAPEAQLLQYTLPAPEKSRVEGFALSPDGRRVAMIARGIRGSQIWLRALDAPASQPLPGTEDASYPFWSPDSRWIAFFAQGQLKKISASGGPAQVLCPAPEGRSGSWNAEGVIVFTATNGVGISRVPMAGGVPVQVTKAEVGTHRFPVFLPDGRRFLYVATGGKDPGVYLASIDAPGVNGRRVVSDNSTAAYAPPMAGSAVGHLLFVRDQSLMAQPVNPETLQEQGDVFPVAERISHGVHTSFYLFSIAAGGILVYETGATNLQRQIAWVDANGKQPVPALEATVGQFALDPLGHRVATTRLNTGTTATDLWISDLDRKGELRLTIDGMVNQYPVWSPNGDRVVYSSTRNATTNNLFVRAANGTGQDEPFYQSSGSKVPYDWSRDGRYLIFAEQPGKTKFDLFALPMTGSANDRKPIALVNGPGNDWMGQVSPDGKWLAYVSDESGVAEVYVQPFAPGWSKPAVGKWTVSTMGGSEPRWRADGAVLFYLSPDQKLMAADVKSTGDAFYREIPKALFEVHVSQAIGNNFWYHYQPRADGKQFLVAVESDAGVETPPLSVVTNWLALKK